MVDEKFLKLVRAQIGAENIQKKSLARKCRVSRPKFSEIIHGYKPMTETIRERLIKELRLETHVERLGL
jgi:plasmid maintenance system antidote protein VapI